MFLVFQHIRKEKNKRGLQTIRIFVSEEKNQHTDTQTHVQLDKTLTVYSFDDNLTKFCCNLGIFIDSLSKANCKQHKQVSNFI